MPSLVQSFRATVQRSSRKTSGEPQLAGGPQQALRRELVGEQRSEVVVHVKRLSLHVFTTGRALDDMNRSCIEDSLP